MHVGMFVYETSEKCEAIGVLTVTLHSVCVATLASKHEPHVC